MAVENNMPDAVQSRRDLLKKVGIAAGALVWSTPIVQTIATGTAGAETKDEKEARELAEKIAKLQADYDAKAAAATQARSAANALQATASTLRQAADAADAQAKATGTKADKEAAEAAKKLAEAAKKAAKEAVDKAEKAEREASDAYKKLHKELDKQSAASSGTPKGSGANGTTTTTTATASTALAGVTTTVPAPPPGAAGCTYFKFVYTDSTVDEGWWCGGNTVTSTDTLVGGGHISVPSLHVSCSDSFPNGYSNGKSDLGGKRVDTWVIGKDGGSKTCSSAGTTSGGGSKPSGSGGSPKGSKGSPPLGSPAPGKEISHMDLVVRRRSDPNGTKYGIQYEFGKGWGPHPTGGVNKEHCLAGYQPWGSPTSFDFSGFAAAVWQPGGDYTITINDPDVVVVHAFSKCGQLCRPADLQHGTLNTWIFRTC